MTEKIRSIAIIGTGPRGLSALEELILNLKTDLLSSLLLSSLKVILFEETSSPGSGPVYRADQPDANWINIPERKLQLGYRKEIKTEDFTIPDFPDYLDWKKSNASYIEKNRPDFYPPRNRVGTYLQQRFESLFTPLKTHKIVSLVKERVDHISPNKAKVAIETRSGNSFLVDEVLLTIGHQPVEDSEQIRKWKSHASNHTEIELFTSPYPVEQFEHLTIPEDKKLHIGVRGFGLAMIDAVRAIAEQFGTFVIDNENTREVTYHTSKSLSDLFIPFSLDGLPLAPKPLDKQTDDWFKPDESAIQRFKHSIQDKRTQQQAEDTSFLINAITPVIATVFDSLDQKKSSELQPSESINKIIYNWLSDDEFEHPLIIPKTQPAEVSMRDFLNMAIGKREISLDYCIGQVWRHCQPAMYDALSFNECSSDVIAEIVQLDERMKRYAFGPPVESIQQLLSLISSGIINLNFVENPEISLEENGWLLSKNQQSITTSVMIDSVLDGPKLLEVNSPLIKSLLQNASIKIIHSELGIKTNANGYILSESQDNPLPIALLGRLAKGTILGVDSLVQCFGDRSRLWAEKAASQIKEDSR